MRSKLQKYIIYWIMQAAGSTGVGGLAGDKVAPHLQENTPYFGMRPTQGVRAGGDRLLTNLCRSVRRWVAVTKKTARAETSFSTTESTYR